MFVRKKVTRSAQRVVASRGIGTAASVLGAATIFALTLATPVTIDTSSGIFTLNTAQAGKGGGGGGGGNGGGNSGGNDGGVGGGVGGGEEGNNGDGVDEGNTSTSSSTSSGNDRDLLQLRKDAITLAQFTTRISKRYPANEISTHSNPQQAVTFFSEVQAMSGKQITHRWRYRGELAFEATFEIRADLWRVWSTHLLPADMPGAWQVEILDEQGNVLDVHTLNYLPKVAAIATN